MPEFQCEEKFQIAKLLLDPKRCSLSCVNTDFILRAVRTISIFLRKHQTSNFIALFSTGEQTLF